MKKIAKSSKKGFTLLEMMLAIAIILLISGLFVSLIVAVKDSFYRVYNDDDSTDYAALYAQALENQAIYDYQNNNGNSYHINMTAAEGENADFVLVTGANTDTFGFRSMNNFNKNKDGKYKWRVYLVIDHNSDGSLKSPGLVEYTLYMVDNYYDPGKLVQEYKGSFWLPNHGDFDAINEPSVKVVNDGGTVSFTSNKNGSMTVQPCTLVISEYTAPTTSPST